MEITLQRDVSYMKLFVIAVRTLVLAHQLCKISVKSSFTINACIAIFSVDVSSNLRLMNFEFVT